LWVADHRTPTQPEEINMTDDEVLSEPDLTRDQKLRSLALIGAAIATSRVTAAASIAGWGGDNDAAILKSAQRFEPYIRDGVIIDREAS
jgi:hypothetical protein